MSPRKWLQRFDIFNVPFTLALSDDWKYVYQSMCGGILALLIMGLSITYFVYQIYMWQTWQLVTRVTQQPYKVTKELDSYKSTYTIHIYSETNSGQKYANPFSQQNNILTPFIVLNYDFDGMVQAFPQIITKYDSKTIEFQYEFDLSSKQEYYLLFSRCDPQYLYDGQWCADKDIIDNYMNQANELFIQVNIESIDANTFQKYSNFRIYNLGVDNTTCQNQFYFMKQHRFELDKGFGFQNVENERYFSDLEQQTYTATNEYCKSTYQRDVVSAIFIMMDHEYMFWRMAYPSILEVLGNVVSIINGMSFLKFFIMEFNKKTMRTQVLNTVVTQFYPEIKDVVFKTSMWGKVKEITLHNKKIDIQSFETFRKHVRKVLKCKLNFANTIYEISRLQYIVQSLQKREYLKKCHHVGIQLKLKKKPKDDYYEVIDEGKLLIDTNQFVDTRSLYFKNTDILGLEDAILLSHKTKQVVIDNDVDEELQALDFYEANKIITNR